MSVYLQDDPGQNIAIHNAPITAAGATHVTLPQNCSFMLKKITASSGRANRGRMYLPPFGIAEADVTSTGTIVAGTYTTVNNRVQEFLSQINAIPYGPVLFHTTPSDSTPLTGLVLDTRIATQRRRLRN